MHITAIKNFDNNSNRVIKQNSLTR